MPNRPTHLAAGALAGAAVALFHPELAHLPPDRRMLVGAGLGGLGGVLPDLLEPAETPSHRGTAHSLASLGFMSRTAFQGCHPALAILLSGFISHLFLDASTPAGLPLITRGA